MARNGHVIGLLRAYYVAHVTRYVDLPRNSLYYVHVIDLVQRGRLDARGVAAAPTKKAGLKKYPHFLTP